MDTSAGNPISAGPTSGARPAGGCNQPKSLSILTFNLGLLGFRIPGICFVPMAEHLKRRLAAVPKQLIDSGGDIIALQEVYDRRHRRYLTDRVRGIYPYVYGTNDRWSIFGNGLLVLSRHPIIGGRYVPYPGFRRHEVMVSSKGCLCVDIDVPGIEALRLINVHLTVGGMLFPSVERVDDQRRTEEIAHLLTLAQGAGPDPAILVGDFNCCPDIHADHYRQITGAGSTSVSTNGLEVTDSWN